MHHARLSASIFPATFSLQLQADLGKVGRAIILCPRKTVVFLTSTTGLNSPNAMTMSEMGLEQRGCLTVGVHGAKWQARKANHLPDCLYSSNHDPSLELISIHLLQLIHLHTIGAFLIGLTASTIANLPPSL